MFSRKCFIQSAISLLAVILVVACVHVAISQESEGTWQDDATGLLWADKDNGSDVNWSQAAGYCENLSLGGYDDWRLPTINELKTLYDRSLSQQYKIKGPIKLEAAGMWSGSTNNSGDAWSFNFFNGGTSLSPTRGGCSGSGRALCVRGSGE